MEDYAFTVTTTGYSITGYYFLIKGLLSFRVRVLVNDFNLMDLLMRCVEFGIVLNATALRHSLYVYNCTSQMFVKWHL